MNNIIASPPLTWLATFFVIITIKQQGKTKIKSEVLGTSIHEKNADAFGTFSVSKELSLYPEKFKNFYRISQTTFGILTEIVRSMIQK